MERRRSRSASLPARAGDAVTRLSALGTIVAQNVQIQDLQESLDGLDREVERLRARIAALTVQIERATTAAERARLLEQRAQARAQLQELRASRAATAAEARNATIQLELRTEEGGGAAAPGSRLDRALDRALEVLAWEAVVALAVAVALAPLVARRGRRLGDAQGAPAPRGRASARGVLAQLRARVGTEERWTRSIARTRRRSPAARSDSGASSRARAWPSRSTRREPRFRA